jgi:hypothetical protein
LEKAVKAGLPCSQARMMPFRRVLLISILRVQASVG